ncbi:hypothetical protein [Microbulbifer yueqingensis]|uniref:Zinc-finger n=1 Tax=Microbulbifer yueqingensis TaxID=658219 RepID=A0A1G9CWJ4_9GAMM|nr:hypothetical protein [Microbulbifer yueqingensis]SDK56040.1 hypothetical protein SAMN05216212_2650 [Microbulbifer yueqingensis]
MECKLAQAQLEQLKPSNEPELLAHLRKCGECRDFAEDLRILRLLRSLPAPEPTPGFEERVLRAASAGDEVARRVPSAIGWKLATAASLLLAVILALPEPGPVEPVPGLAQAVTAAVIPVTLALNSGRDLAGARIRVVMPEHLQLQGFENQRDLQWHTDLKAGANRLTLPVQRRSRSGVETILIEIEHNGARREFRVPVRGGINAQGGAEEKVQTI